MSNVLRIVLLTVVTIFILCYNAGVYIQANGFVTVHIMLLTQGAGFVHDEH